jgi:hypothetical protein
MVFRIHSLTCGRFAFDPWSLLPNRDSGKPARPVAQVSNDVATVVVILATFFPILVARVVLGIVILGALVASPALRRLLALRHILACTGSAMQEAANSLVACAVSPQRIAFGTPLCAPTQRRLENLFGKFMLTIRSISRVRLDSHLHKFGNYIWRAGQVARPAPQHHLSLAHLPVACSAI